MEIVRRWLPLLVYAGLAVAMQLYILRWLAGRDFFARAPWRQRLLLWSGRAAAIVIALIPVIYSGNLHRLLPATGSQWFLAGALFYGALLMTVFLLAWTGVHKTDLARRHSVKTLLGVASALPLGMAGTGVIVARMGMHLREVEIRVKGLPRGLDGLRIAQLTDLHFGVFFGPAEAERAVAMANETRPHLAVFTGDLITQRGDNLREALRILSRLKADAGVYGCHGNHEIYAQCEEAATLIGSSYGIRYLRQTFADLRFGDTQLRLTGVDYQRQSGAYLRQVRAAARPGAYNVLLSHNPDVFPVASALGFDLTLAGHTHGGQVNVEILEENLNVARFFTPYTKGLYRRSRHAAYVSSGLGTVGVPVRLGAPPEVTLIRLCAV